MKVAFVASEAIPYAKTGGLADVVGTLPKFLENLGIETALIIPRYREIKGEEVLKFQVELLGIKEIKVLKTNNAYLIDYPEFFFRPGLYGTPSGDYPDNFERFTLFCKSVIKLLEVFNFDIVHCHDWQTGLIPLYLKRENAKSKIVFTIHNLGYQGKFGAEKFKLLDIEPSYFTPEGIEYYGDINLLKAGILYSDAVTTVSPTYANEIQSPEQGFGLDGVLRKENYKLYGILNGIDYSIWNPDTDNLIYESYRDFKGKQRNKLGLTAECLLDSKRPLIGMVSRIAEQKGFDILIKILDDIIALNYNFVFLGLGDEIYSEKLKIFEKSYPNRVFINIKFDETFAHRIYAGSDFFLMPSRYEPCGLGQMISLRYGTVPIVHRTGGLADTVFQFNPLDLSGNGFVFEEYSPEALFDALNRAYEIYCNTELFGALSESCMKYDFSWNRSAIEYKNLYEKITIK
uniref:Glycogen synthase n=1 Tax=candidate division WOR-3 bacterium TaxID=2052148 RepID=A0A7C4TI87_UNCW3